MLPEVILRFRREYPAAEVRIQESKSEELFQPLMRDEIKFFVQPGDGIRKKAGVTTELIYKEKLFLVAAPRTVTEEMIKEGTDDRILPELMRDLPFILLKKGHAIREKTDEILERHGIIPHIFMEISSCISAVQLAAAGLGVTIVPQRAVDVLGGADKFCCYRYDHEPDSWDINVVYKNDVYLDQMERCFIRLMKQVFGENLS